MFQTLRKLNVRGSTKRWAHTTKLLAAAAGVLLLSPAAHAQLSGTKTVCASGCDYSSISSAVSDLRSKGINGKTTIEIAKGQYSGSVQISGISGLSATNTLTFVGMGSSPNDVHLYSGTNYVVELNNISYVTLENMHIQNTSYTSYYYGVELNTAKNCVIKNCWVSAPASSSYLYDYAPMRVRYSTDNKFTNNRFRGGYMAVNEGGFTTGCARNTYEDNLFTQFYQYANCSYYSTNNLYKNNTIDSASYQYAYGTYSVYEDGTVYDGNISRNQYYGGGMYQVNTGQKITIKNSRVYNGSTSYCGIYGNAYGTIDMYNNMLALSSNTSYGAFIYIYSASAVFNFKHNTIHQPNTSGYTAYIYNYSKGQLRFKNNILTRASSGTLLYHPYAMKADSIEGNNLYNTGGSFAYLENTTYSNFAAYKAAANSKYGFAKTDINMPVTYKSATDLHIDQNSSAPYARNIGITTDIDNDKRSCKYFVTSGADESNYSGNLHLQKPSAPKFTGPSTGIDGSFLSFVNGGTVGPFIYQWYIDNKLQKDSTHLRAAMTTGTHRVKLVAINCGGEDSATLNVTIKDPASAPTSDFISDRNIIDARDTVKFTDGSSGDPSKWTWDVVPATAIDNGVTVPSFKVVYGSLTSDAPWIQFLYAGNYKICLTTSNKKGAGNTECKSAYVEVKPIYDMGKVSVINDTAATFYDDGGKNGNEGVSTGDKMILLDPCASDVYLTFSMFDVMCGYNYVRIYDGDKVDPKKELTTCTTNSTGYGSTGLTGGTSYNYCYSGTTNERCIPSPKDTFHAKSGRMLIVQDVNYAYQLGNYGKGFEAKYWSKAKAMPTPTAKFSSPDSVCTNGALSFKNESSGTNVTYLWDLDGDLDAFESNSATTTAYPYYVDGQVTVTLIAKNCGGADTFQKTITVYNPPAPSANFTADNTNPTINDVVFFSLANPKECVDNYKWTITSASGKGQALFVNGSKNSSPNPQVTFTDTGCYSVELYTDNSTSSDNLKLNCYIKVKGAYCVPSVGTQSADLGISKVIFNTISNTSSQGVTGYNNFVPNQLQSTTVETGVTYKLTVERTTAKNKATRNVWIDWNGDGDFNDSQELVATESNKSTLSWSTDVTIPTIAKTGATIMRISIDLGSQTGNPCGPNKFGEFEDYRLYVRPDLTKPVIKLVGDDTVTIEQGQTYTDEGATASDNLDGDITSLIKVSEPISGYNMIPGIYTYSYNVTDAALNDAVTVRRRVIVTPDVTAPNLVVVKPDTIMHQVLTPFAIPTIVSADDLVDGDLKGAVQTTNGVNHNVVGEYDVTYSVTDRSKNNSTVVRHVIVIDTIMPTLVLVGSDNITHEVGNTYNDSGVAVKDNYYSESVLRNNLTVTSNLDENKVGVYTIVYTLKDPFTGKTISVSRTVEVRDTEKPTVSLNGKAVDVIDVFDTYSDLGVTANDNYDDKLTVTKTGSYYTKFPNGRATELGTFNIVYTVTDASGNSVSVSRDVTVVDREAPTGSLKGSGYVSVCRWSSYTDEGVNAMDNFDSTNKLTITPEGTFFFTNTSVEGIYNLRYKIVDQSGNIGYTDYRYIFVRNPYEAPCSTVTGVGADVALEKLVNVYPNPNTGKFTVEANLPATEQVRISVTNLLGQEVAVISNGALNQNTFSVDLSNQKAGVYLLNITTSKQSVTKRIVVTK